MTGSEDLTWDGRAKGFLDDPNMYGAFLLPGIIGCMHILARGGRRALYGPPEHKDGVIHKTRAQAEQDHDNDEWAGETTE